MQCHQVPSSNPYWSSSTAISLCSLQVTVFYEEHFTLQSTKLMTKPDDPWTLVTRRMSHIACVNPLPLSVSKHSYVCNNVAQIHWTFFCTPIKVAPPRYGQRRFRTSFRGSVECWQAPLKCSYLSPGKPCSFGVTPPPDRNTDSRKSCTSKWSKLHTDAADRAEFRQNRIANWRLKMLHGRTFSALSLSVPAPVGNIVCFQPVSHQPTTIQQEMLPMTTTMPGRDILFGLSSSARCLSSD